jgi:hypothetical protein
MHRHVVLNVNRDVTVDGTVIPSGLYHGHEIWRETRKGQGRKVILEKRTKNGRLGVYGIQPFDITKLLGGSIVINTSQR